MDGCPLQPNLQYWNAPSLEYQNTSDKTHEQKGSYSLEQFLWEFSLMFWGMGHPVHLNILWSIVPSKTHCKIAKRKKRNIFKHQSKRPKNNSLFVMILKVGLPSLNAFFSGSKSWNDKVSVPIRKRIKCRLQNSPYFYSWCHFYGSYDHLKHGVVFFGTPCSK